MNLNEGTQKSVGRILFFTTFMLPYERDMILCLSAYLHACVHVWRAHVRVQKSKYSCVHK